MAPLPELSHEQRMELAAKGEAMPDGSYPTPDCRYWEHAIDAYGRETSGRAELRRYLVRRKAALGCTRPLPESWRLERTAA